MAELDGLGQFRPVLVQEGASIMVKGFSTGPKPYEEVLTFLRKGTMLQKYGRHGNPKYHYFRVAADDNELQWDSKNGRTRRVALSAMTRFQRGQDTDVFRRYPQPTKAFLSFSIIYLDAARKERSLDAICSTASDFEAWYYGLQVVITTAQAQQGKAAEERLRRAHHLPPLQVSLSASGEGLPSARTPKPSTGGLGPPTYPAATLPNLGPVISTASVRREIGDLYVWGSLSLVDEEELSNGRNLAGKGPGGGSSAAAHWQESPRPVLVHATASVNVVKAACGTRHAALISRAGELYTWGYGAVGSLGHGSLLSQATPRRVEGRWVKSHESVVAAASSDTCTAAVTSGGSLYTWGKGLGGQLGHGTAALSCQPRLVTAFPQLGLRVMAVSCGAFHTAAITSDGALYTWGNGLAGKLGHGSHAAALLPRKVLALSSYVVSSVSCGWWHTAAVAQPRSAAALLSASSPATGLATSHAFTTDSAMVSSLEGAASSDTASALGQDPAAGQDASAGREPAVRDFLTRDLAGHGARDGKGSGVALNGYGRSTLHTLSATSASNSDSDIASVSVAASVSLTGAPFLNGGSRRLEHSVEGFSEVAGGGLLFTWGGDLAWVEPAELRGLAGPAGGEAPVTSSLDGPLSAGALGGKVGGGGGGGGTGGSVHSPAMSKSLGQLPARVKKDNHKGCLGLGDREGRLLPTRVRGELEAREVVQVACGWNLTVALTRDGSVYQMGSTGAYNPEEDKGPRTPAWEGALVPMQVDGALLGLVVEEVAVGMHHVVVVASRLGLHGRQQQEEVRRSRLLAWGKGGAGQLGLDQLKDYNQPQAITAIDGRRVLHIACGGSHTFAVCEHDPRDHARRQVSHHAQRSSQVPSPPSSAAGVPTSSSLSITRTPTGLAASLNASHRASYGSLQLLPAQPQPVSASAAALSSSQQAGPQGTLASWLGSQMSAATGAIVAVGSQAKAAVTQGGQGYGMDALRSSGALASAAEERQAKMRTQWSKVVGLPNPHQRLGPSLPISQAGPEPLQLRRRQRTRHHLATHSAGHMDPSGQAAGQAGSGQLGSPRPTLSSSPSIGPLSCQSSPDRKPRASAPLSGMYTSHTSPASSVSEMDPGSGSAPPGYGAAPAHPLSASTSDLLTTSWPYPNPYLTTRSMGLTEQQPGRLQPGAPAPAPLQASHSEPAQPPGSMQGEGLGKQVGGAEPQLGTAEQGSQLGAGAGSGVVQPDQAGGGAVTAAGRSSAPHTQPLRDGGVGADAADMQRAAGGGPAGEGHPFALIANQSAPAAGPGWSRGGQQPLASTSPPHPPPQAHHLPAIAFAPPLASLLPPAAFPPRELRQNPTSHHPAPPAPHPHTHAPPTSSPDPTSPPSSPRSSTSAAGTAPRVGPAWVASAAAAVAAAAQAAKPAPRVVSLDPEQEEGPAPSPALIHSLLGQPLAHISEAGSLDVDSSISGVALWQPASSCATTPAAVPLGGPSTLGGTGQGEGESAGRGADSRPSSAGGASQQSSALLPTALAPPPPATLPPAAPAAGQEEAGGTAPASSSLAEGGEGRAGGGVLGASEPSLRLSPLELLQLNGLPPPRSPPPSPTATAPPPPPSPLHVTLQPPALPSQEVQRYSAAQSPCGLSPCSSGPSASLQSTPGMRGGMDSCPTTPSPPLPLSATTPASSQPSSLATPSTAATPPSHLQAEGGPTPRTPSPMPYPHHGTAPRMVFGGEAGQGGPSPAVSPSAGLVTPPGPCLTLSPHLPQLSPERPPWPLRSTGSPPGSPQPGAGQGLGSDQLAQLAGQGLAQHWPQQEQQWGGEGQQQQQQHRAPATVQPPHHPPLEAGHAELLAAAPSVQTHHQPLPLPPALHPPPHHHHHHQVPAVGGPAPLGPSAAASSPPPAPEPAPHASLPPGAAGTPGGPASALSALMQENAALRQQLASLTASLALMAAGGGAGANGGYGPRAPLSKPAWGPPASEPASPPTHLSPPTSAAPQAMHPGQHARGHLPAPLLPPPPAPLLHSPPNYYTPLPAAQHFRRPGFSSTGGAGSGGEPGAAMQLPGSFLAPPSAASSQHSHRPPSPLPQPDDGSGVEGGGEGGHPFAAAVSASPRVLSDSKGSRASSVADVISAAGPAMLRTKAASLLEARRHHHRRAQSVDVSRLSVVMSSPSSTPGQLDPSALMALHHHLPPALHHHLPPPAPEDPALAPSSPRTVPRRTSHPHRSSPLPPADTTTHPGGPGSSSRLGSQATSSPAHSLTPPSPTLLLPPPPNPPSIRQAQAQQQAEAGQQQQADWQGQEGRQGQSHGHPPLPLPTGQQLQSALSQQYGEYRTGGHTRPHTPTPTSQHQASSPGLRVEPPSSQPPTLPLPPHPSDSTSPHPGPAHQPLPQQPLRSPRSRASSLPFASAAAPPGHGPASRASPLTSSAAAAAGGGAAALQARGFWVEEPVPGVYLWLRPTLPGPGGQGPLGGAGVQELPHTLFKIRFSRRNFDSAEATEWWGANKDWLAARYIVSLHTASSQAPMPPHGAAAAPPHGPHTAPQGLAAPPGHPPSPSWGSTAASSAGHSAKLASPSPHHPTSHSPPPHPQHHHPFTDSPPAPSAPPHHPSHSPHHSLPHPMPPPGQHAAGYSLPPAPHPIISSSSSGATGGGLSAAPAPAYGLPGSRGGPAGAGAGAASRQPLQPQHPLPGPSPAPPTLRSAGSISLAPPPHSSPPHASPPHSHGQQGQGQGLGQGQGSPPPPPQQQPGNPSWTPRPNAFAAAAAQAAVASHHHPDAPFPPHHHHPHPHPLELQALQQGSSLAGAGSLGSASLSTAYSGLVALPLSITTLGSVAGGGLHPDTAAGGHTFSGAPHPGPRAGQQGWGHEAEAGSAAPAQLLPELPTHWGGAHGQPGGGAAPQPSRLSRGSGGGQSGGGGPAEQQQQQQPGARHAAAGRGPLVGPGVMVAAGGGPGGRLRVASGHRRSQSSSSALSSVSGAAPQP